MHGCRGDITGSRATLRLQAAVLNLTDRRYWRWSDVRGLARSSTVIDGYSAPGRSVQVSLRADF